MTPLTRSLDIVLFGGPTFFDVNQELVTEVDCDHTYPYDEATFAGASRQSRSMSTVGFNVGADLAFYVSRWVGIGGTVRFSRASVELASESGNGVVVDAGGVQTSGGLRIRF